MGRLRDGWRAYRSSTAKSDEGYVRDMTPILLLAGVACVALGECGGAAIAGTTGLFGLAFLWRRRRSHSL